MKHIKSAMTLAFAITSTAVAAQPIEGEWRGRVDCSALLPGITGPASSAGPYTEAVSVTIAGTAINGFTDNSLSEQRISGSTDGSRVHIVFEGKRKDRPTYWQIDLIGKMLGSTAELTGSMGTRTSVNFVKIRTCALKISSAAPRIQGGEATAAGALRREQEPRLGEVASSDRATPGQPSTETIGERDGSAQRDNPLWSANAKVAAANGIVDEAAADRAAAQGATSQLPPNVVARLKRLQQAVDDIGKDLSKNDEGLADELSSVYERLNFGWSFNISCNPLQGPYRLAELGQLAIAKPFHWSPQMEERVVPLWKEFIGACPGSQAFAENFLRSISKIAVDRKEQVAAARARLADRNAAQAATQNRINEQQRIARQEQEEIQQRAQAARAQQETEARQKRIGDLKAGKLKPTTITDAALLHDAKGDVMLIYSPRVGSSLEMVISSGILKNVMGNTLQIEFGDKLFTARVTRKTIFLKAQFGDLRLNRYITLIGTYSGMDQNRGYTWATFDAAYIEQ